HKNSITNRLHNYFMEVKKSNTSKKKRTKFEILKVCAVKSLSSFEPEWPEKTSADYWREKFSDTPYRSFMREYMHVHVQDGAVFKHEDILYCDPLPYKKYDALCLYGDLSYKANADYKALVLCGKTGKEFHVLHSYVRQKSRADAAKWLYDLYEAKKLSLYNIRYLIEGLFAMDEFVNDFDSEGELRGYIIPVKADKKSKADKYDRIESMAGFFEKHLVKFSNKDKGSDQTTMIDQLLAFEKGSQAHDDAPDALQSNFAYLNKKTHQNKSEYYVSTRTNQRY
ncbi:MAG: phage terminase large subunit, partial [Flectobacillus sp.]|uniref:phage terminase large subunit n=1 Tax=Flectobacillus sp. TaxID=50419 RepID=UPI003B9A2583